MPPKKQKLSGLDLQSLIEEYRIDFKGPVPPREWPKQHKTQWDGPMKHRFDPIREIWGNRYDDDSWLMGMNNEMGRKHEQDVTELRKKAYGLRRDINLNEATWRDTVETFVMKRFEGYVICRYCGAETHKARYVADPLSTTAQPELGEKRAARHDCSCRHLVIPFKSRDDEYEPIFRNIVGMEVSHGSDETGLKSKSISMKPDRIIGLTLTNNLRQIVESCPWDITHNPMSGGIEALYPFLVVEAKKEKQTPGFKAIERQTAFAIRRLLVVQDKLQRAGGIACEPPLVWFFAYQGEEWRLYAGTIENSAAVNVYDLWHGTIESEDGALQLLQIVDYIWTWARDIYRPQIRACLRGPNFREMSPASTIRLQRSMSIHSVFSIRSSSQGLGTISSRAPTVDASDRRLPMDSGLMDTEGQVQLDQTQIEVDLQPTASYLQDAESHPFLQWSTREDVSIRHSNIVAFSFRTHEISNLKEHISRMNSESGQSQHEDLIQLYMTAIPICRHHLDYLERYWTSGDPTQPITGDFEDVIHVSFVYQTYCQPSNWQIVREMNCIVWPSLDTRIGQRLNQIVAPMCMTQDPIQYPLLMWTLQQLQGIRGQHSVNCALDNLRLVLVCDDLNGYLSWDRHDKIDISEDAMKTCLNALVELSDGRTGTGRTEGEHDARLLMIGPTERVLDEILPGVNTVGDQGDAIIAWKHGPPGHSKICLFVFLEDKFDDRSVLLHLLHEARKESRIASDTLVDDASRLALLTSLKKLQAILDMPQ